MVTKNEAFPSKYYRGDDVARPLNVEIQHCQLETLKNREGVSQDKLVIYFVGQKKSLVCNRVNWDAIVEITGEADDTDLWVGHRVCLFQNVEPAAGKMTPCVRVRAVTVPAKKAAPAPKKAAPPSDDVDDAPQISDDELERMRAEVEAHRDDDDDVI